MEMEKNDPTSCCKFQNLLLDCQSYKSIFIVVSNEMVNTGNCIATVLISMSFVSQ